MCKGGMNDTFVVAKVEGILGIQVFNKINISISGSMSHNVVGWWDVFSLFFFVEGSVYERFP